MRFFNIILAAALGAAVHVTRAALPVAADDSCLFTTPIAALDTNANMTEPQRFRFFSSQG
ncbi:hypothetical protein N7488_012270 [Penicillium malachiteum]|nr:hypothetical protein N7488_012270 [Penicillium malachiteum]